MAKRKNYPEEFKRDAVDLVRSSPDRSLTDIERTPAEVFEEQLSSLKQPGVATTG